MIRPEVQTGGRDGSHSPVSLGHELFAFVARKHLDDHLLSVYVGALDCLCLQLSSFLVLLLNSLDFLLLDVDGSDLHSEYDVLYFALSETGHVNIVLLGVVGKNEVLEFYLDLDPLLVTQVRPNVVRQSDCRLVWLQHDLRTLCIQMQSTQD